jgi:hypothetical protein
METIKGALRIRNPIHKAELQDYDGKIVDLQFLGDHVGNGNYYRIVGIKHTFYLELDRDFELVKPIKKFEI